MNTLRLSQYVDNNIVELVKGDDDEESIDRRRCMTCHLSEAVLRIHSRSAR